MNRRAGYSDFRRLLEVCIDLHLYLFGSCVFQLSSEVLLGPCDSDFVNVIKELDVVQDDLVEYLRFKR